MKVEFVFVIFFKITLLLSISPLRSQDITITNDQINDAALDFQGNLYLSTSEGDIVKYDREGRKLFSYSSPLSFPVSSIDVAYGSRVIGYYAEVQSVLILDRNLKELMVHDLTQTSLNDPACLAYSEDNMLVIYDNTIHHLIKYDPVQSRVLFSTDLSVFLRGRKSGIRQVEVYHNHIYLLDEEGSLYLFDNLGNYIKKASLSARARISFYQNQILYLQGDGLGFFDLNSGTIRSLDQVNPGPGIIKAIMNKDFIWLIYPDHAAQYQLRY